MLVGSRDWIRNRECPKRRKGHVSCPELVLPGTAIAVRTGQPPADSYRHLDDAGNVLHVGERILHHRVGLGLAYVSLNGPESRLDGP